jgi:Amino acid synthesis
VVRSCVSSLNEQSGDITGPSVYSVPMTLEIRSWYAVVDEIHHDGGPPLSEPLIKVAIAVTFRNPYAGRWSDPLDELVHPSGSLAASLVDRAKELSGGRTFASCGKAAIVGLDGEQEHAVACLTSPVGDAIRDGIGGSTWVSSTTKVASAGTSIDVPLAHKNALFVRGFYDAITVTVPGGPRPDEISMILAFATGTRPHNRSGGLTLAEATAGDGLR